MQITIYGTSDDLVEVEGCKGGDEFTAPTNNAVWRGDLVAPDGGSMRVHVIYDGCWYVAVGPVEDDLKFPLPSWPLSFRTGDGDAAPTYSTVLTVEAPDGTRLTNVGVTKD